MRAAAVQFFATPFALERNLQTAERLVREAASRGAQLIALPELFNTGYVYARRLPLAAEADDGHTLRWMKQLSAELDVHLAGTLLLREGAHVYDIFALVEPNGRIHKYRKQHPFLWERCYFEEGKEPLVAETSLGRLGLMVCWDIAFRSTWDAYRGKVDALIIASAPPRLHRAVLNFPEAHKVYVAELMPELAHNRDAIDRWYFDDVAMGAAYVGAPVVHSVMGGRFVSEIPFPRLSFGLAAMRRPRYVSWIGRANLATMRATFYGTSAVFGARGEALARVAGEEGIAMADVGGAVSAPQDSMSRSRYFLPGVPDSLPMLDLLWRWLGSNHPRR